LSDRIDIEDEHILTTAPDSWTVRNYSTVLHVRVQGDEKRPRITLHLDLIAEVRTTLALLEAINAFNSDLEYGHLFCRDGMVTLAYSMDWRMFDEVTFHELRIRSSAESERIAEVLHERFGGVCAALLGVEPEDRVCFSWAFPSDADTESTLKLTKSTYEGLRKVLRRSPSQESSTEEHDELDISPSLDRVHGPTVAAALLSRCDALPADTVHQHVEPRAWQAWVTFLRGASQHGGFSVAP